MAFREFVPLRVRRTAARYLNDSQFFHDLALNRKMGGRADVGLGRVACVGRSVYQLKKPGEAVRPLINLQKARVDLLMDVVEGRCRGPKGRVVEPYLVRKDIYPMIVEQRYMPWRRLDAKPSFLIMDSFAELTDQRFVHKKQGWSFCSHYTDIDHTTDFDSKFLCEGRLDEGRFFEEYDRFFNWFFENYPDLKVFFISYSTKFDGRPEFARRAKRIDESIDRIGQRHLAIRHILIDENDYLRNEDDDFPYHYHEETYRRMLARWERMDGHEDHQP